jgi:hypothetical protein
LETQRLKTIQIPDRTLGLLESFATSVLNVPVGARRLNSIDELPRNLRRHVGIGPDKQYVWFAWSDGERTSLLTGALSLEHSRERGRPVLEVRTYDPDGLLDEAAIWVRIGFDQWVRCSW